MSLNSAQFLKTTIKLAFQSCKIIKDSYQSKNIKHYLKAVNDPVTEIDFKIQSMLIKGIKINHPTLKIVGEQQKDYQGIVQTIYQSLQIPTLPQPITQTLPTDYSLNESCLWIDPIDNTKGFIKGSIQAVTTLIGMSYNKKAELGVVGLPFKKNKGKIYYNPSILVGSVSGGFAYEYYPLEKRWVELRRDNIEKEKLKIILSPYRENTVQNLIAQQIKAQKLYAGGSGYKMATVAKKQVQIMTYCLSHTQKWDTCAGQAVIKGMNGYVTTQFGQEILYNPQNPKQFNRDGLICSLDRQLQDVAIQVCKKYNKEKGRLDQ